MKELDINYKMEDLIEANAKYLVLKYIPMDKEFKVICLEDGEDVNEWVENWGNEYCEVKSFEVEHFDGMWVLSGVDSWIVDIIDKDKRALDEFVRDWDKKIKKDREYLDFIDKNYNSVLTDPNSGNTVKAIVKKTGKNSFSINEEAFGRFLVQAWDGFSVECKIEKAKNNI